MFKKLIFFFTISCLIGCQQTVEKSTEDTTSPASEKASTLSTADKIAQNSGLEAWEAISQLNFTFNVDNGTQHFERSWSWNIESDDVTLRNGDSTVDFNRRKLDSTTLEADQKFINDSYWLLAPFKLVWDEGTNFSEQKGIQAPISKEMLNVLTVTYTGDGGYTPGDAYDFYYDDDFRVREWIFRKGNAKTPSMITTFEDYKDFDGLSLATMHKDSTENLKIYFTNISVKK